MAGGGHGEWWRRPPADGGRRASSGAVAIVSVDLLSEERRSADGSAVSRPSMNNRHGPVETLEAADLPGGSGLRPLSVEPERRLRDEAVHGLTDGPQSRPWYAVLNEWRDWYDGYRHAHIEYECMGKTVRSRLQNSYQPEYGKRYYAKLKDFERAVERRFESLTTVMLTFTASHVNMNGNPRCPGDHMREVADGWGTARKLASKALSGRNWEYARVWEPHKDGYGHLHVAIFVEGEAEAEEFRPTMESYVKNVGPAGRDAHSLENAVSVNANVENLGSYISEYIGVFGKETLERPISEQMFYAVTWATNTRRVDFSNGAQRLMRGEQFRRETGLRPEDRGGDDFDRWRSEGAEDGSESEQGGGWTVRSICTVRGRSPSYSDPTSGGVEVTAITGRPGMDPPARRG